MLNVILRSGALSLASALFGILLLLAFVLTHQMSWSIAGIYRYDVLLAYALMIQVFLVYFKLETPREVWVIAIFHILAMAMELFLTHPKIGSWDYPEQAICKIANVPLFAGFMYSAVGSFIARGLRLFNASFTNFPSLIWVGLLAVSSYVNFFTKFFVPDIRNILFLASVVLFWKTKMFFQIHNGNNLQLCDAKQYQLPFLPLLLFLAFLVWLAENIATFANIWQYPSQENLWHMVGWGKLGSWYLLLILSLVLVLVVLGKSTAKGRWQLI
ncbi:MULTISPECIES: DUF817 family protein [unclassified Psychrobacter]|uniref:DUF817 family protein n=1 Tax=unclassified Psychrobacter TaxID=196806 RepID=UPI0025B50B2E|nr:MULTISPECIES: DUF817 family protein [unclassified Psychrobacter]MDN3453844.1 DUF817 family protein [Psychrobacter sp. APC 3350]MDN3501900.1 DUF817 family protein [Psychrobacter sp. 5A.1]